MRQLVRLAALMALAGIAGKGEDVFEYLVAPAGPGNQRNSEADILRLEDGRLLLAWIEFYGGRSDWAPGRISAMYSRDLGRSWGGKFTLQENIGAMNVMEPDLLRLESGRILFLFARKNSEGDCRPFVRISTDDARTFSAPRPLPVHPDPSYTAFNHDRAIQLRSGRILLPLFHTTDYRIDKRIRSRVYYSDDAGETWRPSRTIVDVEESLAGAQEPGVVELKDGRVMMWLRTSTGKIHRCYSADRGETWSKPEAMELDSPLSPQSIKRIPSTGDLLLVWNHSSKQRFPLNSAISGDEGRTWRHINSLDDDPAHTYAYTSIEFVEDRAIFTYYASPRSGVREAGVWSLKLKSVPVKWLYR